MAWHRRSFDDKERIEEVGRLVLDAVRRRKRRQRLDAEEDDRDEGDGDREQSHDEACPRRFRVLKQLPEQT